MSKCRIFYELGDGNNLINFALKGIDYIYYSNNPYNPNINNINISDNTSEQLTLPTGEFLDLFTNSNNVIIGVSSNLGGTNLAQTILETIMSLTGADMDFLLGQGVGLFNTDDGWSGNLNNVSMNDGYWLNIQKAGINLVLEGDCPPQVESDEVAIEVDPSPVLSTNGYENNLFSYIPPLQEDLDISQLSNFFFTNDCETPQEIPDGSIIYHQSVDNFNQ